jgi:hypothetical protein
MSALVEKAVTAKRESKWVDFKSEFDPESTGDWCELVKDIVAMANSGGGAIVVGLDNGGAPSKIDVTAVLDLDHAKFVDKIRKYTGFEFGELEVHEAKKQGDTVAVIEISAVKVPMVFTEVGAYEVATAGKQKQKVAFSRGTVYFRHGAKSEPGTTEDIRNVIERQLEVVRGEWLDGVRKVVRAPQGSVVTVFSGEVRESNSPEATPIRLVDDPNAPGYRLIDHDTTYPHRRTELVEVVNAMLPQGIDLNSYDILAVRSVHGIDGDPRYCHTPKFGSPQYSDNFAKWIVDQHKENKDFFVEARQKYYDQTHGES